MKIPKQIESQVKISENRVDPFVSYYYHGVEKALESIDAEIARNPNPSLLINKGVLLFELGGTSLSNNDWCVILLKHKSPRLNQKRQAIYAKALAIFEGLLKDEPDDYYQLNNKGAVLTELRRYNEAEATFIRAIKLIPYMPECFFNLGICHVRQGKYSEGLVDIEDAIAMKPFYPLFQVEYAKICSSHGAMKKGVNEVDYWLGMVEWYRRKLVEIVGEQLKEELTPKEREVLTRIQSTLPQVEPWPE